MELGARQSVDDDEVSMPWGLADLNMQCIRDAPSCIQDCDRLIAMDWVSLIG